MSQTRPQPPFLLRLWIRGLLLCLPLLPATWLPAQDPMDQETSFDQIQELLTDANKRRDPLQQGLAWYKWAFFEEKEYGNRTLAFEYLVRSANLFLQGGDSLSYYRARVELADRLPERSQADAQSIRQEALDYFKRHQKLRLETHLLARLARVYQSKGDAEKGRQYQNEFREKNRILGDTLLEINFLMYESGRYQRERNYHEALNSAFRVLQLADQTGHPELAAWAEYHIGYLNELAGDYAMALRFLKRAEKSVPRSDDTTRRNVYHYLAVTYEALDSLNLAHRYALQYGMLGDTLLQRERQASIHRLAHQFDIQEKTRQLETLTLEKTEVENAAHQQRLFLGALIVGWGALLLAMFFIIRDYRHRLHTNKVIAAQNEEINQRMIRQLEDNLRIETMQSMLEGQESERRRVAHDLHDSIGGLLAATRIRLESLSAKLPLLTANEEFTKIKNLLDDTIAETRQIARNLQPGALHQFGLIKAVRDLTGRVQGDGVPAIEFQHFGDFSNIDHSVALNCYRIIQELIQNSLKHAQASEILVQLTRTDKELILQVEDNGIGYDPATMTKGMGTDNVAQRAQFLKGEFHVHTAPGQGTSTMVTIPLGTA